MTEQSSNEIQRRIGELRVPLLIIEQGLAVLPQPDVDVHPAARFTEEYMRETGVADQMVVGPEFEFYLFDSVRSYLMVMVFYFYAPILHHPADLIAQVKGEVLGQGGKWW